MERHSKILYSFILLATVLLLPKSAFAADLLFSPSSGTYTVGQHFTVSVAVSSEDQAMNAVSAKISFPSDTLEVVSLSKSGIMSLWVTEPSFSNSAGEVNFEGVVLNPGYKGPKGTMVAITFKAKASGTADLLFSSSAVLANDGKGSNILNSVGSASFAIGNVAAHSTTGGGGNTPIAPTITSSTHPESNHWYSNNNPEFSWDVTNAITAVRTLNSSYAYSVPTNSTLGALKSRTLKNVADGILYFHVELQNKNGWGAIAHYKYQVDTEKPYRFDIKENQRQDTTDPRVTLQFNAADKTSGIDHYEIQADTGATKSWVDDGSHLYTVGPLEPGRHLFIAKTFDRAGNFLASSFETTISPLVPPTITDYPRTLRSTGILFIKGTSKYPNSTVQITYFSVNQKEVGTVRTGADGSFTFIADKKFAEGLYSAYGIVIDSRGAESTKSEQITFVVEPPLALQVWGALKEYLALFIIILALLISIIFIIMVLWKKSRKYRRNLFKETREAEDALRNAFVALQDEVEDQIAKLNDKDDLTERERKVVKDLRTALRTAEKYVGKEIKDIEDVLTKKK